MIAYKSIDENNPALLLRLMNRTQRQVWISLRALQTTETLSLLHNDSFRVEERRRGKESKPGAFYFCRFSPCQLVSSDHPARRGIKGRD